jgi:hypothetical protein
MGDDVEFDPRPRIVNVSPSIDPGIYHDVITPPKPNASVKVQFDQPDQVIEVNDKRSTLISELAGYINAIPDANERKRIRDVVQATNIINAMSIDELEDAIETARTEAAKNAK